MIVFVDQFTKMAHFAPIPTYCDAKMAAKIFMEWVFVNHGMPRVVITDRDPRFTNRFWKRLMESFGKSPSCVHHNTLVSTKTNIPMLLCLALHTTL